MQFAITSYLSYHFRSECYHQLMDISIEMEKFGINPYTTLTATESTINDVSELSSIATQVEFLFKLNRQID